MAYVSRRGRRRGRKSSFKRRRPARKSTKKLTKLIRKVAKKVIIKTAETKTAYLEPTGASFNVQATQNFPVLPNIVQTSMYQLFPTITLGTNAQNRIGNKIKPKGLYVKGHIYGDWSQITGNNSSFQTIYVRIMCIADKTAGPDNTCYSNFAGSYSQLLNKGATSTNFLYTDQTSLYRPVNKNRFTVYYDKVIKLGMYSANVGTANVDQAQGLRRFSFKVPMKEEWIFDDNITDRPTNASMPNLVCGYCPGDSRYIVNGAITPFVKMTYYSDFYYTDM